jgi:hypothetical protein
MGQYASLFTGVRPSGSDTTAFNFTTGGEGGSFTSVSFWIKGTTTDSTGFSDSGVRVWALLASTDSANATTGCGNTGVDNGYLLGDVTSSVGSTWTQVTLPYSGAQINLQGSPLYGPCPSSFVTAFNPVNGSEITFQAEIIDGTGGNVEYDVTDIELTQ